MRAVCWHGKKDVRVDTVPDPRIVNGRDAIVKVSLTAICGSDLHLYDGVIPTMREGDVLGHEFMGEVVEVGPDVDGLGVGDRVVVPFTISCGSCRFCRGGRYALCDNSNPNAQIMEKSYGHAGAGIYGYSHMMGGYPGGQAEYVRVPFADVGPIEVPESLSDEDAVFLSDIYPTGYQAAELCDIHEGDVVGIWGAGPVGQFAARSALSLGASQVIVIDRFPGRLARARAAEEDGRVATIDYDDEYVYEAVLDLTGGEGPDACIDAVGLEAHGHSLDALYDRAKVGTWMASDRIHALRQAIRCCRKGGTVVAPGVYGGFADKFPVGALFGKGLTLTGGQTHVQQYLEPLLRRIERHEIEPSEIISHRMRLDEAPEAYRMFQGERDDCMKVVLTP